MKISLTDREATLMDALWENGPSTVAEVREHIADDLAYTTVLTTLRILETKGYVTHKTDGRAHRYVAAVSRDVAQRSALQALTAKLFRGSRELLLTQLVSDRRLSEKDLSRIASLLDEQRKKRRRS